MNLAYHPLSSFQPIDHNKEQETMINNLLSFAAVPFNSPIYERVVMGREGKGERWEGIEVKRKEIDIGRGGVR